MQITEHELERVNIAHHQAMAPSYDEARVHPEIWSPREQCRLRQAVVSALRRVAGAGGRVRALDVGAGTGNLTRHLLDEGCGVTALDLSGDMLQVLQRNLAPAEPDRLRTVVGSASRLPFDDGCYDFVGCYSVLHHVLDYIGVVREMTRVLKPGGVLFIDHEGCAERWTGGVNFGHFEWASQFIAAAPYRLLRLPLLPVLLARRWRSRPMPEETVSADHWVTRDRYIDFAAIRQSLLEEFTIMRDEGYLNYGQARGRVFDLPGVRNLWGALWSPFVVSERLLVAVKGYSPQ